MTITASSLKQRGTIPDLTQGYKRLANSIIRHASGQVRLLDNAEPVPTALVQPPAATFAQSDVVPTTEEPCPVVCDETGFRFKDERDFLHFLDSFDLSYVKIGPFEVRPGMGQEVPIGRAYQPLPNNSISRLAGYLGRDEHSLYIREVPEFPDYGLRPSRFGVWVRQADEESFRRLEPGQAERIYRTTAVRIGGDGQNADSGTPVQVFA